MTESDERLIIETDRAIAEGSTVLERERSKAALRLSLVAEDDRIAGRVLKKLLRRRAGRPGIVIRCLPNG